MAWLQPLPVCQADGCQKAADHRLLNERNIDYGVYCRLHGNAALMRLNRAEQKEEKASATTKA